MLLWLALGTQFLHKHGIAHNDLKPENAMGGAQSDYVKLIDFGTAKYFPDIAASSGSDEQLSSCVDAQVHCPVMSLGYSSPEVEAAVRTYKDSHGAKRVYLFKRIKV